MKKKATFGDLAKAAKVSASTVSRVAAGQTTVDAHIRDRVYKAAKDLGIDLSKKKGEPNKVIAFLLSNRDILHSFQSRVLAGAESYTSSKGWELIFMTYRYSDNVPAEALHLPQILRRRTPPRGLILAGVNSHNLLEILREKNIPYSVLGNNLLGGIDNVDCDTVCSDDFQGARDVTQHLIGQGHERIWYIGDTQFPWYRRCGDGYCEAMEAAGLEPKTCTIRSNGHELGYLGTKMILNKDKQATAIFAGADEVAGGVYSALRDSSLSIPDDMSVVGFNDVSASFFHPGLTSVREFPEELGRHLAEFTINRILDPMLPPQQLTIPTQLVTRDSTRPARARRQEGATGVNA